MHGYVACVVHQPTDTAPTIRAHIEWQSLLMHSDGADAYEPTPAPGGVEHLVCPIGAAMLSTQLPEQYGCVRI